MKGPSCIGVSGEFRASSEQRPIDRDLHEISPRNSLKPLEIVLSHVALCLFSCLVPQLISRLVPRLASRLVSGHASRLVTRLVSCLLSSEPAELVPFLSLLASCLAFSAKCRASSKEKSTREDPWEEALVQIARRSNPSCNVEPDRTKAFPGVPIQI